MTTIDVHPPARRSTTAQLIGVEVAEGLRAILREPTALFFSVLFPVMFFALFASLFGNQTTSDGMPYAARMLANYSVFGVVSVMMMNPGIGVANDRTTGWLRVKKVSAAPIATIIAGKVLAALPYALGVLVALGVTSLAVSGPVMGLGSWLVLVGVLLLGSLPFALFGLAVGFVTSANATAAVLNAIFFPMVVASGLWFPLEMMPGFVQAIAALLPTYHLAQLAAGPSDGGSALGHVLALLLATLVTGGLAAWTYRRLRV